MAMLSQDQFDMFVATDALRHTAHQVRITWLDWRKYQTNPIARKSAKWDYINYRREFVQALRRIGYTTEEAYDRLHEILAPVGATWETI